MRVLKFIVNKQLIELDPNCDFSGLVPGTEGYLKAEFSFSPEWQNCTKVVSFWSMTGREYSPQILNDGKTCIIPTEALRAKKFRIQVIGKKKDFKLTTNKVTVSQDGGI